MPQAAGCGETEFYAPAAWMLTASCLLGASFIVAGPGAFAQNAEDEAAAARAAAAAAVTRAHAKDSPNDFLIPSFPGLVRRRRTVRL